MQVHSLTIDDFSDNNYTLIGLHTTLEDYKLAYLLNKHLKMSFFKASFQIDVKKKNNNTANFPVYEYYNSKLDHQWFLIANVYKETLKAVQTELFVESENSVHLIPEKKKVDFFIKLEGECNASFIENILNKINKIQQVITSYTIEVDTLKSKEFLIF